MSPSKEPALEQLQADLIFLMNRYSGQPSEATAHAIAVVMRGILGHPLIELFPEFREQCANGLGLWKLRACSFAREEPAPSTCTTH